MSVDNPEVEPAIGTGGRMAYRRARAKGQQQPEQFDGYGAAGIALPRRLRRKTLNRSDGRRMCAKIQDNHRG